MFGPLFLMAGIAALIAGVVAWAMALRYGRRRALVVPVLAVVAAVASAVRGAGIEDTASLERVALALALAMAFAGPAVAGALIGLVLARPKAR